jgi:2-(1,2-epoxy-1,2-dihydrophenyl)acetyl-CoA isomerase
MADFAELRCAPGPGGALDAEATAALTAALRGWTRTPPAAAVIEVVDGAWDHAPVGTLDRDTVRSRFQTVVSGLLAVPCPVVVALDGPVRGVGLSLALAADLQFATPRTTVSAGTGAPAEVLLAGASWLIAQADGLGSFAQLAWLGADLSAERAVERGLISAIGTIDAARARTAELARDPVGWSAVKRGVRSRSRREFAAVLSYESWLADVAANDGAAS